PMDRRPGERQPGCRAPRDSPYCCTASDCRELHGAGTGVGCIGSRGTVIPRYRSQPSSSVPQRPAQSSGSRMKSHLLAPPTAALLPPLVMESVGRDVGDLVWERLAALAPGGAPMDEGAFQPRLASRWERLDSLTLRFHLRPGAAWHDGAAVTGRDVAFSFAAY